MSVWPALRLPGRVPISLRVFFRGAFLLLALATLGLALVVLREEKQLSWRAYQDGFQKNHAQIAARLRHPTGQLALLNPGMGAGAAGRSPLLLPFSAIDFDDKAKAQQAIEMAGCQVQYADASLCVAVGSNPAAGGFIYVVGSFTATGELVPHAPRTPELTDAHRARVSVALRGQTYRWLAPFEAAPTTGPGVRGRLTGFAEAEDGSTAKLPVRDFRGWLWQDGRCVDAAAAAPAKATIATPAAGEAAADCPHRSFFSIRLPIDLFHEDLLRSPRPVWPPADLDRIQVRTQILPPGDGQPLFDSQSADAQPPFALKDLAPLLQPGEALSIRKAGAATGTPDIATLKGQDDGTQPISPLLGRLIRLLPTDSYEQPITARDTVATPVGRYELLLTGSLRGVERTLGIVATRVSWFVAAMLAAIFLTWLAIEIRMVRRIAQLTKRAAAVSQRVKGGNDLPQMDLAGLHSGDELGLLAKVLSDLMQRVNADLARERIRTEQERDQWQAVGHEIMSPLQSLMLLHADAADPSHRYITRMQQALRILYGSASPSEAFQSAALQVQSLDLAQFLRHVAANAPGAGVPDVHLLAAEGPLWVRADEYSLEDVMTHVLGNAHRHRAPGTPITITLQPAGQTVAVDIHNQGSRVPDELVQRIFEYGVSDQANPTTQSRRGQGLFVAKTYMAKMGGGIAVRNTADGVCFTLSLQVAPAPTAA
jgi:signal transduction histidine kinase